MRSMNFSWNMHIVCILYVWVIKKSYSFEFKLPLSNDRLVDLTYPFNNSSLPWVEDIPFRLNVTQKGYTPYGFWLQEEEFSTAVHCGTHLDAPCHGAEGKWTNDQIPLNRLFGPAAVVDITWRAIWDRDALLKVEDLERWERRACRTLDGHIVLVRSGWGKRYPNKELYIGNSNNDVKNMHFPGISKEAAQWLADKRKIYGIGIDTLSLDNGPSYAKNDAHKILLGANFYGMENVANLEKLPAVGAILFVFPMKIENASGGAVRIIAHIPPPEW